MPYRQRERACVSLLPCHSPFSLYSTPYLLFIFKRPYLPCKAPFKSLLFYEDFPDCTARTNLCCLWTLISPLSIMKVALVMLYLGLPDNPGCSLEGKTKSPSFLRCLTPINLWGLVERRHGFFLPTYVLIKIPFPLGLVCSSQKQGQKLSLPTPLFKSSETSNGESFTNPKEL